MREINHRVKNQYAVILSVIAQTAAREQDIKSFERRVRERIMALSHSQDLLSSVEWASVDLKALIAHQTRPFDKTGVFSSSGPDVLLDANAVLNIGMALHELVVNRVQFSETQQSDVDLSWAVTREPEGDQFELIWRETGVTEPDLLARGNGFGSLVLKRIVAAALGGESTWSAADDAIVWTLKAPLPRIQIRAG
jgi:two-component sensor histidine kinase